MMKKNEHIVAHTGTSLRQVAVAKSDISTHATGVPVNDPL